MVSRIIKYFFIVVIMFLFAILYNERYTFVLFATVLLFPMLLFLTLMVTKRSLRLEVAVKNPILQKGEKAEVLITIQNPAIFPIAQVDIGICYYHALTNKKQKEKVYASLLGKSQQELSVELSSLYSGMLVFDLEYVRIYDLIKLFSLKTKCNQRIEIMVEPKVYELLKKEVPQNPFVYVDQDLSIRNKKGDDPSEIFSIREYQEGDKLHKIHWKLSYKQQKLMVKEYVDPLFSSAAILLELIYTSKEEQLHCMDSLLDTTVSVANWYVEQKAPMVVYWYDLERDQLCHKRIATKENIYELLPMLFTAKFYGEEGKAISEFTHMETGNNFTHMIYLSYNVNIDKVKPLKNHSPQSYVYILQLLEEKKDISKEGIDGIQAIVTEEMYSMSLNSYNLEQELLFFQERYLRGDEYDF